MRTSKFSEEQISGFLQQAEAGNADKGTWAQTRFQ